MDIKCKEVWVEVVALLYNSPGCDDIVAKNWVVCFGVCLHGRMQQGWGSSSALFMDMVLAHTVKGIAHVQPFVYHPFTQGLMV